MTAWRLDRVTSWLVADASTASATGSGVARVWRWGGHTCSPTWYDETSPTCCIRRIGDTPLFSAFYCNCGNKENTRQHTAKVTTRPELSRTVLYFWVLSWISRCSGFVLDLKCSDPSLENVYISQYYVLNVRLMTTAHYLKHPCSWMENCTKFGQLILSKIIKIVARSYHITRLNASNSIWDLSLKYMVTLLYSRCGRCVRCGGQSRNKHRIGRIGRIGCKPTLSLLSLFHSSRRHVYVMHVCCIAYNHRGYTKTR